MESSLAPESELEAFEVSYRVGTDRDAARMAQLLQNHYNWINVYYSPFSVIHRKTSEEILRESIQGQPCVVAEYDGLVVGFAFTRPQEPSVMELRNIYVDDPFRRHGIGRNLIERIEVNVMAEGFSTMLATSSRAWYPSKVLPTNLFKACGYNITEIDNDTELYIHKLPISIVKDRDTPKAIRHITYRDQYDSSF